MENQAPKMSPTRFLALRFISGKYQGGEFPLSGQREIIVGRSSELDMVLVEDMVSRRHARIACSDQQILIEDLGSTNGTFVNGEKIKRTTLKEGDRVLIGTSILKVVSSDTAASAPRPPTNTEAGQRSGQTRSMSGSIEEIPLPDLLQLFGSSKKNAVLIVKSDDDVGKIFLRKGVVYFASINDLDEVSPLKSVYRMLTWTRGAFELAPPDERTLPNEVHASVQELLMEGLRQIDELNALRDRLPELTARLVVPHPLSAPLADLEDAELRVFQLAYNYQHLSTVLNKSAATDLDTARIVMRLVEGGYFRPE
jgi:hypothetical protein